MLTRVAQTIKNRGFTGAAQLTWYSLLWRAFRLSRKRFANVKIHGFRMIIDLRDPGLSRELFLCRNREKTLGKILRSLLKRGMKVLDVGGNIGYYPLLECTLVGNEGKIYVLEPFPPNFELLNRNINLNGFQRNIEAYMVAALDKIGYDDFYVAEASNLGTLFPDTSDTGRVCGLTGERIKVQTIDLSTFLKTLEKVDLIRMDPEGAEVGILKGLVSGIKSNLFDGRIVTEVHPSKYAETNNDIRPVLGELFDLGYYPEVISSDDEPNSRLHDCGCEPEERIRESNTKCRGIYRQVEEATVLKLVTEIGVLRDLVLAKRK